MSYSNLFLKDGDVETQDEQPEITRYQILFVDDEPNILKALKRGFRQENYITHIAKDGETALAILKKEQIQLIISDFKMPGMNGAELLKRVKNLYPDIIRIMLTGEADTNAVMGAINEGAVYKFILKPWNDDDLRITIGLALEKYDLVKRNKALQKTTNQQKKQISSLAKLAVNNRSQLAMMLHKNNLINDMQLQELHKQQQARKQPLLRILLEKKWVTETQIRKLLRKQLMIEEVALAEIEIDSALADLVPGSFCERQWAIPLKLDNMRLMLALADPLDDGLVEDLRFITGMQIDVVMANTRDIEKKITELYGEAGVSFTEIESIASSEDPFETIEVVIEEDDDASLEELLRSSEEPPAVRLINAIVIEAVRMGVSDIHIQPRAKSIVVRYRIDGILLDKIHIPLPLLPSLVSRIKVMASLDISKRRLPQDGRITVKTPMRIVDMRISTLPTVNGEKVVMRILDRNAAIFKLDALGFTPTQLQQVELMINQPQGIILATGPTGSGKTTTLYSLLQHTATPTKNFVTIEDPVEYYLDQAGQVNVLDKIELSFSIVLRSILRQDPDVILLGEIRDFETAEVTFHAAMTGHLVYSTLHTNSALATIARLFDLGLKPYVISAALVGVLAQRLLRKICAHCKEEVPAEESRRLAQAIGGPFLTLDCPVYRGAGCGHCNNTGYKGRIPIYEVLQMTQALTIAINSAQSHSDLVALDQHMHDGGLIHSAYLKICAGISSLDEVLRILGPKQVAK